MKTQKQQGFTIIEVVLVLAIAGLIFLIVFLAVPALQRSQRDTQRKNDVSRLVSQVTNFSSNNKGQLPVAAASAVAPAVAFPTFVTNYLNVGGDVFEDPTAGPYTYLYGVGSPASTGQIRYANPGRCGTDGAIVAGVGKQVAASVKLEGGIAYCQQN